MTIRGLAVMLLSMAMVAEAGAAVTKAGFGKMPDGTAVDLYTLKSDALEVKVMTYGARIVAINTADKNGKVGDWHARMKFYNGEDPATGSAAGPAIAWLVKNGLAQSGQTIVIEQGVEMLRPSRLHVSAKLAGENITEVEVGGRTIPVAMGRLFLP